MILTLTKCVSHNCKVTMAICRIYEGVKKQYLKCYNNVKKHSWKVLVWLPGLDLMPFLLKLYFGKVPSHISYLWWFMNVSLSLLFCIKHDVCHFFGILWALFSLQWASSVSSLLGLAIALISYRNVSFFCLMIGYTTPPCDICNLIHFQYWPSCPQDSALSFVLKEYAGENKQPCLQNFPLFLPDSNKYCNNDHKSQLPFLSWNLPSNNNIQLLYIKYIKENS